MNQRREDRREATLRGPSAKDGSGESAVSAGARPVRAVALDRFGLLCAVLAAVGFSGKAILVKLAYRYGVDAETLLALRMVFSLPFFIAMDWMSAHRATRALTGLTAHAAKRATGSASLAAARWERAWARSRFWIAQTSRK